jgi:hypothetical protein
MIPPDDPHDAAGILDAMMASGRPGRFVPLRVAEEWRDRAALWGVVAGVCFGVLVSWLVRIFNG